MVLQYRTQGALGLGDPKEHLARMPLSPGATVIDWGCGPGRVTVPLAGIVGQEGKVLAIDIQPLALEIVTGKAARAGLSNVETLLFRSHPVSVAAESVDLVVLVDTFPGILDRQGLLSDIARVLRTGGHLFMDPGHMSLGKARALVEESGLFQLENSWGRDMLFGPTGAQPEAQQK